jgi:hypothetical protein
MPKICFDQLPFLLLLQLSTNVAESTQEQTQECTHRLTQTELQISLCSHHTLLRQAIKLTLATATSPHLCTLLLLSSLICATDAHSIIVRVWSA